jgi:hypothetical protein
LTTSEPGGNSSREKVLPEGRGWIWTSNSIFHSFFEIDAGHRPGRRRAGRPMFRGFEGQRSEAALHVISQHRSPEFWEWSTSITRWETNEA